MANEYQSIFKAISIFGGSQVIQILISLIRSKFIAILIGGTGLGMSSMYMSSLTLVITIFGAGINSSVVRDLTKVYDKGDTKEISLIITIFRRLLLALSVAGMIFVIATSPWLSVWAFNTSAHSVPYIFLSLVVLFTLLSQGNQALLVSNRRIKDTAKCSLIGSIVTLITSVPFFYFWRLDGIVPGLVVSTISNYMITYYYAHKIKIFTCKPTRTEIYIYSKSIFSLGISMVIATLLGNVSTYLINIFISRQGSLADLGYYNAGINITMQSVMLVFSAMASDYYPRLIASMSTVDRMNNTINRQTEIILFLAVPILAFMILASPFIITLLLSSEFQIINGFIRILCIGMLLRASAYALGYVSFAKGDKKVYLYLEGIYGNVANVVLSVVFYYIWGLKGLALSFVVNYGLYLVLILTVDKRRYHYRPSATVKRIVIVSIFVLTLLMLLSYLLPPLYFIPFGTIAVLIITYISIKQLDERTQILTVLKSKFKL